MPELKANGQITAYLVQRTLYFRCVLSSLEPVTGLGTDWSGTATISVKYRRLRRDGTLLDGSWTVPTNAASGAELGEGWYSVPLTDTEMECAVMLWSIRDGAAGATFKSFAPYFEMYGGSGNLGGIHTS